MTKISVNTYSKPIEQWSQKDCDFYSGLTARQENAKKRFEGEKVDGITHNHSLSALVLNDGCLDPLRAQCAICYHYFQYDMYTGKTTEADIKFIEYLKTRNHHFS
jgi:hypothetical protein